LGFSFFITVLAFCVGASVSYLCRYHKGCQWGNPKSRMTLHIGCAFSKARFCQTKREAECIGHETIGKGFFHLVTGDD
jgi:hypothetical protein